MHILTGRQVVMDRLLVLIRTISEEVHGTSHRKQTLMITEMWRQSNAFFGVNKAETL